MLETERVAPETARAPSEVSRILDELDRAVIGEPWHGDSLMKIVRGVDATTAAARPIADAHTIWEIALHLSVWHGVVARRLRGESIYPPPAEDWPSVRDATPEAWQRTLRELEESHAFLRRAVAELDDARLDDIAPGRTTSLYVHLHGVAQHAAYHAGQIALLKKALGSRPPV